MPKAEIIDTEKSSSKDQMRIAPLDKEFDPYDYGMEDGYGLWGASVHIFRYTFGTGILLLPYVMNTVGYVNAIILMVLVSIFYLHNAHILISHEYRLCKLFQVKQITYTSLAEKTFENAPFPFNKFGAIVSKVILLYLCLVSFTSAYLLIFASSVQNLAKFFDYNLDISHIITVAMVPILIFSTFKKLLKILVPLSAITNFFSVGMAVVLLACCIIYRDPKASVRPFGDLHLIPQTVAVYILAFTGTPSILPVKNYMKQPQRMGSTCGAMNITAFTLTFIFISFALISYFCFGDKVEEDILSNLPKSSVLSFTLFFLYAVIMLVMYLLGFSVCFHNVWPDIERKMAQSKFKVLIEFGVRIALNAWAYFLAVGMPNFALISTFFGTMMLMFEVTLIPILELALVFQSKTKCLWTIVKDLVMIIICVSLCYMSLVDSIKDVQKLYSE